jgi:hypothetical protein
MRAYGLQYFYALMFDDELVNRSYEAEVDTLKLAAVLKPWLNRAGEERRLFSIKL